MAMRAAVLSVLLAVVRGQDLFLANDLKLSNDVNRSADVVAKGSPWDELRALLQGWEFTSNYAVVVGDKHGHLFKYEGGNFTLGKQIPTGSTSKWPSAMMFAGLVNDGSIGSLDDKLSKYLTWWTKDPKDLRSMVTFRMLLSFTSGFGDGNPGEEANTRQAREWRRANKPADQQNASWPKLPDVLACNLLVGDIMKCAQSIYSSVKLVGTPGKVWSYNSNHLQLAAAVAVAASGLDIQQVISKYLLVPYGMSKSSYPGKCPEFAAGLITTGYDYENFLSNILNRTTLQKSIMDASEEDSTPFLEGYSLYGHYGFGHFLMCFDSFGGFTDECKGAHSHMDPGAFGFIPIIDRKYGYYVAMVAAELPPTGSYPLSGIPEYLAVAIKKHTDVIMSGASVPSGEQSTHSPAFLSLSISDVNYCLNCVLHPKSCL